MAGKWHKFLLSADGGDPLSASDIASGASPGTFLKQTSSGLQWSTTTLGGETSLSRLSLFGSNQREVSIKCLGARKNLYTSYSTNDGAGTPVDYSATLTEAGNYTFNITSSEAGANEIANNYIGCRIVSVSTSEGTDSGVFSEAIITSISDWDNGSAQITLKKIGSINTPILKTASNVTFKVFNHAYPLEEDAIFQAYDENGAIDHAFTSDRPVIIFGFTGGNTNWNTTGSLILFSETETSDVGGISSLTPGFVVRNQEDAYDGSMSLENASVNTQFINSNDLNSGNEGTAIGSNSGAGAFFMEQLRSLSFEGLKGFTAKLETDQTSSNVNLDTTGNLRVQIDSPQDLQTTATPLFTGIKVPSGNKLWLSDGTSTSTVPHIFNDDGDLTLKAPVSNKVVKVDGDLDVTGNLEVTTKLTVAGDLEVQGTTTTIDTTNLTIKDKNIVLADGADSDDDVNLAGITLGYADGEHGNAAAIEYQTTLNAWVANRDLYSSENLVYGTTGAIKAGTTVIMGALYDGPNPTGEYGLSSAVTSSRLEHLGASVDLNGASATDEAVDGGGFTLKGSTDKTILWDNDNDNWTSNQDWNLATGKVFRINDVNTLSATTLGSTVVDSHLRKIGGDNATEETYYGSGTYPTDENGEPIVTLGSHILHIGADYGKSLMSGSIAEKYRKTPKIVFNHVGDNSPATSQIQQKAEIWFDARNDVTGGNSSGDGKGGWINLSLSRRTTSSGSGYAFEDDGFYGSTTKFGMSILAPGENEKALNIYLNNPSTGLEKGYIDFGNVGEGIILLDYNVENAFQIGHNASGSLDSYLTISTDANDEKITLNKDVEVSENLTLAQDKVLKADFIDATEEDDSNKRIEFLDYEGTPVYAFEDARFDLTSPSDSGNDSHDRVLLQTQNLLLNLSASDENENGQGFVIGIGRKAQFSDGQGEMINFTNSGSNFYYKVQNENKLFEVLQSSEGDALGEDASGNAHAQPAKAAFYVPLTLSNQTHDTADTSYTFPSARGSNNQIMVTDSNGILSWADPASEGATYTIGCADGANTDEEKIVLTGSDNSTDEVVLEAGAGLSISRSNDKITFVNTETDTNTWIALTGAVSGYVTTEGSGDTAKFLNGNAAWSTPPNDNTTYSTSVVGSGDDAIIRLTAGGSGSGDDDVKLVAGTDISLTPSGDDITIAYTGTTVSVLDQTNNELITSTGTTNELQSEANLTFDGSTSTLEIAGSSIGQLDVDHRKLDTSSASNVGEGAGDVTYAPDQSGLTAGKIYHLNSGTWELADASVIAKAIGLLGVALGSDVGDHGMLLRGIVKLSTSTGSDDGGSIYLDANNVGQVVESANSTSGEIIRHIGYNVDASASQIYFSPDNTFIEVA